MTQNAYKVVHLTATNFGGAGKAAYRLHKGLIAGGIDSTMIVMNRKGSDESVKVIPCGQGGMIDCPQEYPPNAAYAQRVWQQWNRNVAQYPQRDPHIEVFTDDYSEILLQCSREIRDADIINLHWVPGVVNWVNAAVALKGKKIVWTMHDMNPFTGGCHYSGECTRYRENCGSCPMLGSQQSEDLSRSIWQMKDFGYGKLDLHPVAPSRWLARCASESALLAPFPARVIPNGFPTDVFRPYPKRDEVRRGYGIAEGAKVIMFGAESLLNGRKGFIYLVQALKNMPTDNVVLAVFGLIPEEVRLSLGVPVISLGFVGDEITLAALYSMADIFVIPSIEDNLPNTVAEAMLCGVPVVGFDIGGIPDMIEHQKTGYVAAARDIRALAEGIAWSLYQADAAGMGEKAREKALRTYSLEAQAASYAALYREILTPVSKQHNLETGASTEEASNVPSARTSVSPGSSPSGPEAKRERDGGRPTLLVKSASPRISLVTPSYNYGHYLEACIDSALSQNYPNLEFIIMDGGSSDDSVRVIQKYQRHLAYWQSRPDGGNYSAIEEGFKRSSGEIMTWLNADDMFHPDAFETVRAAFADPEVEWTMGHPNSFDEQGRQKHVLSFLPMNSRAKYLADQELIQQEGVFWRRGLWERSGGYIEKSLLLAADLELWARFFRSARLYSIDTLIAGFRDHPLQKSKDKAGYTAEANRVLAREREVFAAEKKPFNPPPPLPLLLGRSASSAHPLTCSARDTEASRPLATMGGGR